jgi:hypothetical protein
VEEKIKAALLAFNWGGYGMDDIAELADEDPDIGVFDDLAAILARAVAA